MKPDLVIRFRRSRIVINHLLETVAEQHNLVSKQPRPDVATPK
jgi:hypothetical protein